MSERPGPGVSSAEQLVPLTAAVPGGGTGRDGDGAKGAFGAVRN